MKSSAALASDLVVFSDYLADRDAFET
jgi:hypothetical protein